MRLGALRRRLACALLLAASAGVSAGAGFTALALPGEGGALLQALERPARAARERLRLIVLPGSGCAGMGAIADRYFAALLHARVLVLHKRGVRADATTAAHQCPPDFVQQDAHPQWQADALAAARHWLAQRPGDAPLVLLGISEGAELLAPLAARLQPTALVLVAGSGLDPVEAGRLQAQRLGAADAWEALARAQAGSRPDTEVVEGRSLRYWRALWHWPVQEPLLAGPWPLVQVWGERDALVPQEAYERFRELAAARAAPYCAVMLPGADHDLQSPGRDGLQWLWGRLEQWARAPAQPWCAVFRQIP
ncbi:alpha/beta hydrolase [Comamonas sp. NLF-1-9]|uniref:alpha/beta hydrolase n=1 Tax=Comamonas sp. NLF-1-9 TaxID=2853163 RepID=UPI001C437815|nr:alpha/beta hydrolase [Comamonas sp. NLF-1-9]QXL83858.1 alpha/beta hydrolase [Comamonas sp. NLF-1-9]